MRKILALDTSAAEGSITLLSEDGSELWTRTFQSGRREGGQVFAHTEAVAKDFGAVDKIVVGLGPGSYSGIRQAVALAQGLQLAWGCKLAGIASACGVSGEAEYQVFGDARRGSYYHTRIRNCTPVQGPRLIDSAELSAALSQQVSSYIVEPLSAFPGLELRLPTALQLGRAALRHWDQIKTAPVEPYYLREPNITEAKDAPRLPQHD